MLLLTECSKGPGFSRSYGETETVVRALPSFHSVSIGQRFQLYLTQDSAIPEQISITYGSHLTEKISATVNNGMLEIKDNNSANWVRKSAYLPICTLNIHRIDGLNINGAAEVHSIDTIKGDRLNVNMNSVGPQSLDVNFGQLYGGCMNTGNISFRGRGTIFAWSCENGSYLDARDLDSDDAYIYQYTVRDIYVNPKNFFEVTIYNSGNVFFKRDPQYSFKQNIQGSGKAVKL